MLSENPYSITVKKTCEYLKLSEKQLQKSAIPYLQYSQENLRYYKKSDLDEHIEKNAHQKGKADFF